MKIKEGIKEVKHLIETYIDLIRLKGKKSLVEVSSRITFGLLSIVLLSIGFTFFCVALALYIGVLLESFALGFLIVGIVPFLLLFLMQVFKKGTNRILLNFFTKSK